MKDTTKLTELSFWQQYGIESTPTTIKEVTGLNLFEMVICTFRSGSSYLVKREFGKTWQLSYGPY